MTVLKLIEQAASLIGTVGIEDSRIAKIAQNAVNRIYCEVCFSEGKEFTEIKSINDEIKVDEIREFEEEIGVKGEIEKITWIDNHEELVFEQEASLLKVFCTGFIYGLNYCVRVAEIKIK